jgi:hypothetical protein
MYLGALKPQSGPPEGPTKVRSRARAPQILAEMERG